MSTTIEQNPKFSKRCALLLIYLTPLIPLSFKGEGEMVLEEGVLPLLDFLCCLSFQGAGDCYVREASPLLNFPYYFCLLLGNNRGVLEGRSSSKRNYLPPSP